MNGNGVETHLEKVTIMEVISDLGARGFRLKFIFGFAMIHVVLCSLLHRLHLLILSSQHKSCSKSNLWCICWYSDLSRDKRRRCQEAAGCRNLYLQWPNDAYQEGSEVHPKSSLKLSEFFCMCLNWYLVCGTFMLLFVQYSKHRTNIVLFYKNILTIGLISFYFTNHFAEPYRNQRFIWS